MPATILSQDIVAICLLLSEGNIDIILNDLYKRLEEYEKSSNRHFGIAKGDIIASIRTLLFSELHIKDVLNNEHKIQLKDIIPEMLNFHSAYFKDTEDYWVRKSEIGKSDILYLFNYSEKEYEEKILLINLMKEFFPNSANTHISKELIKDFLRKYYITKIILEHCSRPGEYS